ncbi:MAG: murein L,D-transpeptidase catalytic domain family protein [Lysobacterales bacterium]
MTPLIPIAAWALLLQASAVPAATDLASQLARAARGADPAVIRLALAARACALESGAIESDARLTLIDYSRPSTEKRLWVFDLQSARVLYAEHVAHGRSSGENMARYFSNANGSHQTSLGLFRTAETYQGGNGYSLRMDGLEPGINDQARPRQIVMHGAPYVNPEMALRQGRLGRSYGCPAVRPAVAKPLIDSIKDGQLLFAYYPDTDWLTQSRFLKCETAHSDLAALPGRGERTSAAP